MTTAAGATFGVAYLLITIFEHRQEARTPYVRLVEVNEISTAPAPWRINWPDQYDGYRQAVDAIETEYGNSNAMPASKLDQAPWLKRLYAGYAFSLDYREARGHAFMLADQEATKRVTERTQSGACLHCHASIIPTYRRLGLEAAGQPADADALAAGFDWPAVIEGFRLAGTMDYAEAHAELLKTPDGTPVESRPATPGGATIQASSASALRPEGFDPHGAGEGRPISCIDCYDPKTLQIGFSRPGFVRGIAALAASDDPVPDLPSIERWRTGDREADYDPNVHADRQELRTFVCAQCHVEYYCGSKDTLFFPWERGLKVEQIEATYDERRFADGSKFLDFKHGETGAPVYKAQHPEFELWSQGIHARSGVSCADCHMPYERRGATKVFSHRVTSPLLNINSACQTCHNVPEAELLARVRGIHGRTDAQLARATAAMTDMLDAIGEAQAAGATEEELSPILELQKSGMWRLDFISSENSHGFHADQEAMRILGESIDYSRQAEAAALRLRALEPPPSDRVLEPVRGVTP